MGINIEDGTGKGYSVKVNSVNELGVRATSEELQHVISKENGQVYQAVGDFASVNNSTHTVLHIKNNSSTKNIIITFVRLQTVDLAGGTAPPNAGCYWQLGVDRTVSSGGTTITPVNVNRKSGNVADATCTDNNPTMTGTFLEIDRYYPTSEADSVTYNKQGSIILGKDDTFEVRLTADNTSGTGYARVTFMFESPNGG